MSYVPTAAEMDAAHERDRKASAAYQAAQPALMLLLEESMAANRELLRLMLLSRPLDELILDDLRRLTWTRKGEPTARTLAKHSYRDVTEVQACLDRLIAEGLVRRVDERYEATPDGAA